ncbi:cysteine hydrolase [Kineosporia sp. J2-2]|uniref:Cysteine hydrolase n=1 Tax=Kineosporia corallincola TaxID=2835133 RepID=A0ABS5TBK7_9ACTN|nr:isochorismatase family cysteine hydrolase [Kineosporia corallincola]MBT0768455.1 cysteine hydrolase [Kineosporia corallincola]
MTTALLVMDVQEQVLARYPAEACLAKLGTAISSARSAAVPVVYVKIAFRPGFPEIHPRNKMFGGMPARAGNTPAANEIHPDVAPEPGDVVVLKHRVSAFAGSDLDMVLRAQNIEHLVLTGVATSGVVLSTLRQAADLDYRLTVLADACLDGDPQVHDVLMTKVFPMQAEVVTVGEWAAGTGG